MLIIGGVMLLRRFDEDRDTAKPPIDDPYFVAFLRGGETETLRVAALSLIDRGLLALKAPENRSFPSVPPIVASN